LPTGLDPVRIAGQTVLTPLLNFAGIKKKGPHRSPGETPERSYLPPLPRRRVRRLLARQVTGSHLALLAMWRRWVGKGAPQPFWRKGLARPAAPPPGPVEHSARPAPGRRRAAVLAHPVGRRMPRQPPIPRRRKTHGPTRALAAAMTARRDPTAAERQRRRRDRRRARLRVHRIELDDETLEALVARGLIAPTALAMRVLGLPCGPRRARGRRHRQGLLGPPMVLNLQSWSG
jgi:hypothetical protein